MTTYLIYANADDGQLISNNIDYATARKGANVQLNNSAATMQVGQWMGLTNGDTNEHIYQSFLSFDTSVINTTEEVVDATLVVSTGTPAGTAQQTQWTQNFYARTWTSPLTTAQWVNLVSPGTLTLAASIDYNEPSTPVIQRSTGGDGLVNAINKTGDTRLVSISDRAVAGVAPTGNEFVNMSTGNSTAKPVLTVYTTVNTTMNSVGNAAVNLDDGTTVSIRASSAATPAFTIGYTPISTTTYTNIGTIPNTFLTTIDGLSSIALTADPAGNLFVLGVRTGSTGSLIGMAYKRTGPTAWSAMPAVVEALPAGSGSAIRAIAATYMRGGTDRLDVPSIYAVVGRGASGQMPANVAGGSWVHTIRIDPEELLGGKSTGNLINTVSNPYTQTNFGAVPAYVDTVAITDNLAAVYVQRGKIGNTTVGGISVTKSYGMVGSDYARNNTFYPTGSSKLVPMTSQMFAHVFDNNGEFLTTHFYNTKAQLLGEVHVPAREFWEGVIGDKFAPMYDEQNNTIRVFYIPVDKGTKISRMNISPTTFANTFAGDIADFSTAGTTVNPIIRVASGRVDERRISIEGGTLTGTTQSTTQKFSTAGNVVPSAPVPTSRQNFDATSPAVFEWDFTDANKRDAQTGFQIEVVGANDATVIFTTNKVTSAVSSYTMPANTLTNGASYRWRVRTYDTIASTGTYSVYDNFTTAATGTVSITAPASNNMAGIDTAAYTVVWTYTNASGPTQAARQVRLIRVSDGAVMSDTGMQNTTALNYKVSGMVSGVQYRVEVTVKNSANITTPVVTRTITPNYSMPMTPTLELTPMDGYVNVQTVNPTPSGDRPQILTNDIYRRRTGGADEWIKIAQVGLNVPYRDYAVKSLQGYEYYIESATSIGALASSIAYTVVAPALLGVWMHSVSDPRGTVSNFLYGNLGRSESIDVEGKALRFIGRTHPVYDTGGFESQSLSIDIVVPVGPDEQDQVEWFRNVVRNRRTICYRDNRGRKHYVIIVSMNIEDARVGTNISFSTETVDYNEAI